MPMSLRSLSGLALVGLLLIVGAIVGHSTHPYASASPPRAGGPADISPDPRPVKKPVIYKLPVYHGPTKISRDCFPGVDDVDDTKDWGVVHLNAPIAWKTATGNGVKVAILDTGIDLDHPDFDKQIHASKDFTGSRSGVSDVNGHGSHTAGTVAAARDGAGLIGVAPDAKLIIAKVLNDRGSGYDAWIAAGIDWSVEQGADIISMSLGGDSPSDVTHDAIKRAVAKGVIVVCAAGNSGPYEDSEGYPAAHPECVSVAAINYKNLIADFSSHGGNVFIAAPGVDVRSCYPGSRYATMSGTSMSCPHVAGLAAIYVEWAKKNNVKPSSDDFKKRLKDAALDLPPVGKDTASGYGVPDATKLFGGAKQPDPGSPDRVEITSPGIEWNGRKVKKIVIEFEPQEKKNPFHPFPFWK